MRYHPIQDFLFVSVLLARSFIFALREAAGKSSGISGKELREMKDKGKMGGLASNDVHLRGPSFVRIEAGRSLRMTRREVRTGR